MSHSMARRVFPGLLLLLAAWSLQAAPQSVVVYVPCDHLARTQCDSVTRLARGLAQAYFDVKVETRNVALPGASCLAHRFERVESCYQERLSAVGQPTGDRVGLGEGEAAILVLLFDAPLPDDTISGSYFFATRGGNWSNSSFMLSAEKLANDQRPVYVVRGGMLAEEAFRSGLARQRKTLRARASSATSAVYGDVVIPREQP